MVHWPPTCFAIALQLTTVNCAANGQWSITVYILPLNTWLWRQCCKELPEVLFMTTHFYRPQNEVWCKVMFSQVFFCPREDLRTGGVCIQGVCLGGICLQRGLHPRGGSWTDSSLPRIMQYGQQAGCMHPAGMYSCAILVFHGKR